MKAHGMKEFAGHGRREVGQMVLLHPYPLAVGTRQAAKSRGRVAQGQGTEGLHFFTTHHIDVAVTHHLEPWNDPALDNPGAAITLAASCVAEAGTSS